MLEVFLTNKYKKDLKKAVKSNIDLSNLKSVFDDLIAEKPLDTKFKDHPLKGDYVNHRECHIQPDWLLIYQIKDGRLILVRTGSHSELY